MVEAEKSTQPIAADHFPGAVRDFAGHIQRVVEALKVPLVMVLGGGSDGKAGTDVAAKLIALGEQLKAATGVDVIGSLRDRLADGAAAAPKASPPPLPTAPASPFPPAKT